MADQPVTLAQLEKLLAAQTRHFDEKLDKQSQHFDEKLENLRNDLMEHVKKVENGLLTAFHNWAAPVAQRMNGWEQQNAGFAQRLAQIETRLYDLERRRGTASLMLHTFVALVEDKPGVLTRVASLFRRLNINITSLTVGASERPDISRMTIVADAAPTAAHRIMASLYKLENVVEVDDIDRFSSVSRELALIKVAANATTRSHLFELANVFRARVVDLAPESLMLEMTGSASKIEGLLQVLVESGDQVLEVSRTGRMVMRRGHHTSRVMAALRDTSGSQRPQAGHPQTTGVEPDLLELLPEDLPDEDLPDDDLPEQDAPGDGQPPAAIS